MYRILAVPLAALAAVGAASVDAATLSYADMPADISLNPVSFVFTGTVHQNTIGNIENDRESPFGDTTPYTSVERNSVITYFFGPSTSLSFVWGFPDTDNYLKFFYKDVLVDTVPGSIFTVGSEDFGDNISRSYVTISDVTGSLFDAVTFGSSGNAFAFAGLSRDFKAIGGPGQVPLPAGSLLLLSAIGAGLATKLRRNAAAPPNRVSRLSFSTSDTNIAPIGLTHTTDSVLLPDEAATA